VSAGFRTLQFRLILSAIDRGLDLSCKLVVPRREDESMTHVMLRVLAYCLFCRDEPGEGLHMAPGPADRDGPDLLSRDLIGEPSEWIICGAPDIEELRYVMQHQRQTKIRILVGSDHEREHFLAGILSFRRTLPGLAAVDLRQVDAAFLEGLAAEVLERQRWLVTVVDGHVYVDLGARSLDGEVVPIPLPTDEEMHPR
jgi:uncharacterized protein YaeQ